MPIFSSRFQMSHITQRQLHRLCAHNTRIGSVLIRSSNSASNTGFSKPCCANMPHPLAADFEFTSQDPLRFVEQMSQRRPYPAQVGIDLQTAAILMNRRAKVST